MTMSFSAAAKAEICRAAPQSRCCALAECFGVLLYCNSFHADGIRIITESREFAQRLPKLFRKAVSMSFDTLPEETERKLVFQIRKKEKLQEIMEAYGFSREDTLALHVNLAVVEEECCKAAFLRGAFLAGGSVTDPGKGYHLEITTTHGSVARECYTLIQETMGFYPKTAARGGGQVLYLKQSELISDYLTFLGAPVGAMGIMEARLETGRTHQIRVHMAYIHHPLVGDMVYGPKKQPLTEDGQLLPARVLGFVHPRTGEYMEFEQPLPPEFEAVLQKLR